MNKTLAKLLMLTAVAALLTLPTNSAIAGYGSNGNVSGLTWHYTYYSQPFFYVDGNGMTYTSNGQTVYEVWVKIRTYNNCGGTDHQISSADQANYNTASVTVNGIPNGTSECGTQQMRLTGEHTIQYYPGGPYTFVATSETKNAPPW